MINELIESYEQKTTEILTDKLVPVEVEQEKFMGYLETSINYSDCLVDMC